MRLVFAYAALSLMASAPTLRAESFVPPPPAEIFSQVVPEPEVCDAFEPTGARIVAAGDFVRTGATVSTLVNAADNTDAVTISPASPGYSVQQSVIFAEGTGAFRLANASFQSVYLTLNDTIVPTSQTRLFFIGVMGYATTDQSAQVEVSTNNGSTWNVVWSLRGAGASGPTQQRFELESISLAPYAGMSIRVRFGAVFTSGSVYNPASSTMIGWYVDDIQIGTSFNGIPYNSVGDPTPDEILAVEYINRARADAVAEAVRLRDTGDADVRSACTFFGVNFTLMQTQFASLTRKLPPLAINAQLTASARLHSLDMFNNVFQDHTSSSNPPSPNQAGDTMADRISRQGYSYSICGENIYSTAKSIWFSHAGFEVDWGYGTGGMQTPPGHRENIHSSAFTEIGVGVVKGTNTKGASSSGPYVVTHDLARGMSSAGPFLVGVTYEDADGDGFYTQGEGLGNVSISVDGAFYHTTSSTYGAYALPLQDDGTYTVTFECDGYATQVETFAVSGGSSVKMDYKAVEAVSAVPVRVTSTEYASGTLHIYVNTALAGAQIDVIGSADLSTWASAAFAIQNLGGGNYRIDIATVAASAFYIVKQRGT